MAAVGMGVGHVRGPLGRGLSRRALRRFGHLVVRDTETETDQTPTATSRKRVVSVAWGVCLAALAAAVVWLAVTRGGDVAELLERSRLPLIAAHQSCVTLPTKV